MNKQYVIPGILFFGALMIGACAAKQSKPEAKSETSFVQIDPQAQDKYQESMAQPVLDFASWKTQFRTKAINQGHSSELIDRLLEKAQYQEKIIELDKKQPEFSKMIWSYLDTAVSPERVANGQQQYLANQLLLEQLETDYGVPAQYLLAIWGLESAYGSHIGDSDLVSALATLAYDGRRRAFAETQLLAILALVENGDINWSQLKGSWAGGMGHTQFIPATYLRYGVDADGDGRRNPWDRHDALAATAHYLSQSGWQTGIPWGQEVILPTGFDYRYVGQTLAINEWQNLGLQAVSTMPTLQMSATLWLPGGHQGPAFLLYPNTDVIKVYNNSSSYALAVGLLADAIAGKPAIQQTWPRSAQPLSHQQVKQVQTMLSELGYTPGTVDGILGSQTRRAFQAWQAENGQIADGFISLETAASLLP